MTQIIKMAAALAVTLGLATAGCGRSEPAPAQSDSVAAATATAPATGVEITFTSDPGPVKLGENTFEVMVMDGGAAVADAMVTAEFFMPAMPSMNMAEMRTKTDLAHAGNGVYRGKGQVMMAGNWDVTVMAMRNGQELGAKKLTVAAK